MPLRGWEHRTATALVKINETEDRHAVVRIATLDGHVQACVDLDSRTMDFVANVLLDVLTGQSRTKA